MKKIIQYGMMLTLILALASFTNTSFQANAKVQKETNPSSYFLSQKYKKVKYYFRYGESICGTNTTILKNVSSNNWACPGDDTVGVTYFQSARQFEFGKADSDNIFFELPFPLYKGAVKTIPVLEGSPYKEKVTNMNKTVKTKAGTFKNCIEIQKVGTNLKTYIAKGKGIVLVKNGSKKYMELQKLYK